MIANFLCCGPAKNAINEKQGAVMKKIKIGCSPLTARIFVGKTMVNAGGIETWTTKEDITEDAIGAVAEHLLAKKQMFCFNTNGKDYIMEVREKGAK